jgi:myo-inositol-1(or 4)-monophosphatase
MSSAFLRTCLDVATGAASTAGKLLATYRGRPRRVGAKRSPIDLVTEVDRASERLLHDAIRRRFPDHGFQGEERLVANPDAPLKWIVDPVDGTTNFVHGVPTFAISIGLARHEELLVGVVYDPIQREMFTAVTGAGARLNGKPIRVSRVSRLATGLLSTGFSSKFRDNPTPYLRWFTAFQSRCHAVRRMGCTSLSLAYVACGRQDGFYERDLWPWDIAAGLLLVQEAGGKVSDFRGHPVRLAQGQVVASNGRIHGEMLAILARPAQDRRVNEALAAGRDLR